MTRASGARYCAKVLSIPSYGVPQRAASRRRATVELSRVGCRGVADPHDSLVMPDAFAQWRPAVHGVMLFGGDVAKKARGGCPAIPDQASASMATPDTLRYASIPLVHGPGAIPAVGFGTLIHDPLAAKRASKTALEVGYRHLDCAERYRTEEAVGEAMQEIFQGGDDPALGRFRHHEAMEHQSRPERV